MLQVLIVENFQPHRRFRLELDRYLTVITGESSKGKTAILRALRWLMTNQPRGTAFTTWGEDTTRATLQIDDHTIVRERGKANTYQLDGGEPFKSFNHDVPQEIQDLLNIDDGLNFQRQLDPAFWFMKSPGEVSRELNKIVNLDRIDTVLGNLQADLRKARATTTVSEERLAQAQSEAARLAWVTQADQEYREIEAIQQDIASRSHQIASLMHGIQQATTLASTVQTLREASQDAQSLSRLYLDLEKVTRNQESLARLVQDAESLCQKIARLETERESLEAELREAIGTICPLCGLEQP